LHAAARQFDAGRSRSRRAVIGNGRQSVSANGASDMPEAASRHGRRRGDLLGIKFRDRNACGIEAAARILHLRTIAAGSTATAGRLRPGTGGGTMDARLDRSDRRPRAMRTLLLALVAALASPALAEQGVEQDSIVIGQSAGFTGQVAGQVKEMTAGAMACFDYTNSRGGVHGRKIVLKSLDDGYDAKRAAANARKLVVDEKVFALAFARGTPTSEAMVPVANELKVPLVGLGTGSQSLHEPFSRYVFNVRAKYRNEAIRIIEHLATIQVKRIAVLYQDNAFGKDGLVGYEQGLREHGLTPVAVVALDGAKPDKDVGMAVDKIFAADPEAVAIVGPLKPTAAFIRAMKAKGAHAQYLALSNLSADAFIAELGDAAHGVVVTQIVPYPWNVATPIVKELHQGLREGGAGTGGAVSYAAMEGCIYAKVIVEGLRQAGRNPTREGFIGALESFQSRDLGGFAVTYGPRNREGSRYIDITMIGRDKTFRR
jgi:ABC-type branched-subunit amino acid transport system substrate-binding protein